MKLSLFVGILLVMSPLARAATDAGEHYLGAYFLIQEAEDAEKSGDWISADAKFDGALKVLTEIRAENPNWQPILVEFRVRYCNEHLAVIKPKLTPAPQAVTAAATPSVEMPAPLSETEQVRQLQTELQKTRDEVKKLEQTRDDLTSKLEAKLQEAAPTDRLSAQQMLEQLRSMQAVNDAVSAKLETAKEKAARADALEAELQQSREKIGRLEAERTGLNAKLQEALSKVSATQTTPQVEELMKKNADLTTQVASAQAEVTKMREAIAGAVGAKGESPDAVKLRSEIGQLQSELAQTKALLLQRTEELSTTRAELEKVRAENLHLTQSQEELMARLNDSDRQLRAAKASTDKDNEIIQQLRKENALLQDIAGKKGAEAKAPPPAKPAGGFLWFKPKPAPAGKAAETNSAVSRSEDGKLTAAVKAPTPPGSARAPDPSTGTESPLVRSLLADARAAIVQQDLETAASKFQSVLAQDPGNATALSSLGVVYYRQSRLDEAEESLRKAVAVAPNDSQARSVLGVVCYRKGRIEDAYSELTRAVALNPRNSEAHNYLGIVMSEKGWATAAEQEVRRAIELNPQYADAHFNLAVIYSRQKTPRLELARYHYQKARDLGAERDSQLEAKLAAAPVSTEKPKESAPPNP